MVGIQATQWPHVPQVGAWLLNGCVFVTTAANVGTLWQSLTDHITEVLGGRPARLWDAPSNPSLGRRWLHSMLGGWGGRGRAKNVDNCRHVFLPLCLPPSPLPASLPSSLPLSLLPQIICGNCHGRGRLVSHHHHHHGHHHGHHHHHHHHDHHMTCYQCGGSGRKT